MSPLIIWALVAVAMLILSAFFSGVEIAFVSSSRLKIELKTRQGDKAASILSHFKKNINRVLITILIGNNVALVIYTMQIEKLSTELLGLNPESDYLITTLIQTLIGTIIILIFAEYLPKAIFRRSSDRIILSSAHILNFFYLVLKLPVYAVNGITKVLLKLFPNSPQPNEEVELGRKDLTFYLHELMEQSNGQPHPDLDTEMLNNALAFKKIKTRECMIPRTEIQALPLDSSIEELMEEFIDTGLSKIIIYNDSLDQVEGFAHSHTMFRKPTDIKDCLQPVLMVPETMLADTLLGELTENKRSVAIVVDEFGGTSGMITMEDLIEEIFGEIEDEHDDEEPPDEIDMILEKRSDGSYLLGARHEIDNLNEDLGLNLPEEEYYTTLGGLILYHAESIPEVGEAVTIGKYNFVIEKAADNRIISAFMSESQEPDPSPKP